MRLRNLILMTAITAFCGATAHEASAHASLPHRHYHGRVYYWAGSQYHPPIWSDDCGTLWSYGDVMVDRAYRVIRVNPLPEEVLRTETRTTTRETIRETRPVTTRTTIEQTEK